MKRLAKVFAALCAVYWLLLAHVSLNFLDDSSGSTRTSRDGKFRVVINEMYPVNPIGLYCFLTTELSPIYFSLYEKRLGYIGQSSPFFCYRKWSDAELLYPDEADGSFVVVDMENNGELDISTKDKRWWSWWFGIFH